VVLVELQDAEFGVFLAQVGLSSAKAAERRAAGAGKAAERMLETENLDLKAAEAEVKAARANKDVDRLAAAEALLKSAERAKKTARQFLQWKEHERRPPGIQRQAGQAASSRSSICPPAAGNPRPVLLFLAHGGPSVASRRAIHEIVGR